MVEFMREPPRNEPHKCQVRGGETRWITYISQSFHVFMFSTFLILLGFFPRRACFRQLFLILVFLVLIALWWSSGWSYYTFSRQVILWPRKLAASSVRLVRRGWDRRRYWIERPGWFLMWRQQHSSTSALETHLRCGQHLQKSRNKKQIWIFS